MFRQSAKMCRCKDPWRRHYGFRWVAAGEMQGPNYAHYVQWEVKKKRELHTTLLHKSPSHT